MAGAAVSSRIRPGLPRGPFLACVFFTWGGAEIFKYYIDACRIALVF